jgi:hypothetical protein
VIAETQDGWTLDFTGHALPSISFTVPLSGGGWSWVYEGRRWWGGS